LGLQLSESPNVLIESHKCDTQVTTFVIGQLCVHTFRSTILGASVPEDYTVNLIPQIWPLSDADINWPNVHEIDDRGMELNRPGFPGGRYV
jgi:hypothetical protein